MKITHKDRRRDCPVIYYGPYNPDVLDADASQDGTVAVALVPDVANRTLHIVHQGSWWIIGYRCLEGGWELADGHNERTGVFAPCRAAAIVMWRLGQ